MDLTEILQPYREQITEIDHEIIRLLARRHEIVIKIADLKAEHDTEIHDPQREEKMQEMRSELAQALGIDPQAIESVFEAILNWSRTSQKKI